MMLKIRHNMFETNSSSMHSIAINMKNKDQQYVPDHDKDLEAVRSILRRDGRLDMTFAEDEDYGWGPELLSTTPDKISYAVSSYISDRDLADGEADADIAFLVSAIDLPEVTGFRFPYKYPDPWYIADVPDGVILPKVPYIPTIDHQSMGTLQDYVRTKSVADGILEGEALHNFLFDPNVVVLILNDNDTIASQTKGFPLCEIVSL